MEEDAQGARLPARSAAPVVGRVHQGRLLLDLLALDPADDERLAGAVVEALGRTGGGAA